LHPEIIAGRCGRGDVCVVDGVEVRRSRVADVERRKEALGTSDNSFRDALDEPSTDWKI